jgi:transposase-like protein
MATVEVLAGTERRRRWSVEQKQAIVAAAFGPGAVVRDVARQADVTPSLIYRWRRDFRAAANGFAQVLVAPAGERSLSAESSLCRVILSVRRGSGSPQKNAVLHGGTEGSNPSPSSGESSRTTQTTGRIDDGRMVTDSRDAQPRYSSQKRE